MTDYVVNFIHSLPFRFVDLETKDMEETSNNIFRKLNKLNRELRVGLVYHLYFFCCMASACLPYSDRNIFIC